MNPVIDLLNSHHSIRSFTGEEVGEDIIESIIEAARCGPTSINGQQVSVIVVRRDETRRKIAELAGGQPWIAQAPVFLVVVADFYKTNVGIEMAGKTQVIQKSLEGYTVGILDAGLTLTNLMVAARSFGLGVVPIGGYRGQMKEMIDLLKLPPMTFPVVGLCVGHIDIDTPLKPKMPVEGFRHDEHYHPEAVKPAIEKYDEILMAYWEKLKRPDGKPWSANTAEHYDSVYFPNIKEDAARQGFVVEE